MTYYGFISHDGRLVDDPVAIAGAQALRLAADAMEDEDGREWPFNGLDEMQRWLRLRADQTEKGEA